jgi:hypothetical protein
MPSNGWRSEASMRYSRQNAALGRRPYRSLRGPRWELILGAGGPRWHHVMGCRPSG